MIDDSEDKLLKNSLWTMLGMDDSFLLGISDSIIVGSSVGSEVMGDILGEIDGGYTGADVGADVGVVVDGDTIGKPDGG